MNQALLERIESAFVWRVKPANCIAPGSPKTDEYQDAEMFEGVDWESVDVAMLLDYPSAIFGFSPEAFAYYLPAIMSSALRENAPDALPVDAVISMLDRSNQANTWDDWFRIRWSSLKEEELRAVSEWILWLVDQPITASNEDQLARAFETVQLLLSRDSATPIAIGSK